MYADLVGLLVKDVNDLVLVDNASNYTESRAAYCLKHDDRSRLKGKADLNELYCYVVACETGEELGSFA